jgi:D-glycero-D-manno-heptose 1,7-bisphosphate phosphatase
MTNTPSRRPAAFLDRDGVLNVDHGYVHRWSDWDWMSGAREAVKLLNDAGWWVFIVTNQSGIARGMYTEADMHALHEAVTRDLATIGAHIDAIRWCPHHRDGVVPSLAVACECRKPRPGMLQALLTDWPVERERSFLIGDKQRDLDAAAAVGIPGHLYTEGDLAARVRALLEKA